MRSLFIVLGFIAAAMALLLAVTPLSQMAYIPALAALVIGFIAFYISKRKQSPKKSVQLIFLLAIISLVLTTYKAVFNTTEIAKPEELELKEETSKKDSIQILEEDPKELLDGLNLDENEIDKLPNLESLEDE